MWSFYDTLILLTGILTAAIAVIPVPAIERKTRIVAAVIGAGVILLSLLLGSLQSFTYPQIVFVAPLIPIVAAGAIVKAALDTQKQRDAAARGEHYATPQQGHAGVSAAPVAQPVAPESSADPRTAAWEALHDPATPPTRLAEIAAAHPEFAAQIAVHPQCYPDLRAWARAAGDAG